MFRISTLAFIGFFACAVQAQEVRTTGYDLDVPLRDGNIPRTRWDHRADAALLTRSALSALKAHGAPLTRIVPDDIAAWCPSYPRANEARRRAFWVGFLSALAKHESTFDPGAIGGGGRWHGLLQIQPSTARGYNCRAGTGEGLRHGPENLSCAIRIMAHTVARDGVVSEGMRGVAADWGPLHSAAKRNDMQRWTQRQVYCRPLSSVRPRERPAKLAQVTQ
ncbi:Transglycosylase SLT domain-containing protein [Roseovarius azorensis]|uniref:Transglycosylase SLT domain-containing protein n=1 Tax=Roseovarius azorensis TaxID=1287727 RepID=A0A1H7T7Q0_9RHOB|nr:transglycosylase SLT domain-containing protein [Roseovarius azorensis]SEL80932.1 Transglycosylase SLT domain-containing protein [Roseovarius azorensis]